MDYFITVVLSSVALIADVSFIPVYSSMSSVCGLVDLIAAFEVLCPAVLFFASGHCAFSVHDQRKTASVINIFLVAFFRC